MAENVNLGQDHQAGLSARQNVELDRILGLQRFERNRDYYHRQYCYSTADFAGNHVPLTARTKASHTVPFYQEFGINWRCNLSGGVCETLFD